MAERSIPADPVQRFARVLLAAAGVRGLFKTNLSTARVSVRGNNVMFLDPARRRACSPKCPT